MFALMQREGERERERERERESLARRLNSYLTRGSGAVCRRVFYSHACVKRDASMGIEFLVIELFPTG